MTTRGPSGPGAPAPDAAAARDASGRPSLALVLAITVTGIMGNTLITPVIPDIVRDLGVSAASGGLVLAAATAPGILLAPVIGLLADRYGRREVLVPCLVLFGVFGGLAAFAPTFPVLLALRFLQGAGSAGLINLAVVLISDHWEGPERTRMIGRNAAALTTSIVVLPPLGGVLSAAGGWRTTFAPYWLALATAAVMQRRLAPGRRGPGTVGQQLRALGPAVRSRAVLGPMSLGLVVFALIFGGFLTTVPFYLATDLGVAAEGRGALLALPAATSTVAALSLGRLRPRFGLRRLLALAFGCFAVGFAVTGAVESVMAVAAGALVYGFGDGLVIATLQDAVAAGAPAANRAAVMALWVGFARAGQTLGPVLAGLGLEHFGARPTLGAGAAIAATLLLAQHAVVAGGPAPPGEGIVAGRRTTH